MCEVNADPHELLRCANARLVEDAKPEMFVTAFIAFVSPDGILRWSSAGHGPVLLRRGLNDELRELEAPGPPLGIVLDPQADRTEPIELSPGALLAIVSDGVFDARNAAGQTFEVPRLIEVLDSVRELAPFQQLDRVRSALRQWQGGEEPADDQSIVLVRRD
jgi:serine phosphatase RsbU (regulator of sigma subunit)